MNVQEQPRKRARMSENSDCAGGAVQIQEIRGPNIVNARARERDEEFWYNDGNIILVARDIEFRMYGCLLAEHSPVFKDMFSLPQSQETLPPAIAPQACPTVHLSDSPHDLRHILRVYMPKGGPSPFFHSAPQYSYQAISAAIRLGHKYQMSTLLNDAVAYLKTYYTYDFDKWSSFTEYGPPGPSWPREAAIGVVNLARLAGDVSLLLMALLVCCTINNADEILREFEGEDSLEFKTLSRDDLGLCYGAKSQLIQESVRVGLRVCEPTVSHACKSAKSCLREFKPAVKELDDDVKRFTDADPSLVKYARRFQTSGLCESCQEMVQERESREKKAAWAKLPSIFGLELPTEVTSDEEQLQPGASGNAQAA